MCPSRSLFFTAACGRWGDFSLTAHALWYAERAEGERQRERENARLARLTMHVRNVAENLMRASSMSDRSLPALTLEIARNGCSWRCSDLRDRNFPIAYPLPSTGHSLCEPPTEDLRRKMSDHLSWVCVCCRIRGRHYDVGAHVRSWQHFGSAHLCSRKRKT